MRSISAIGFAAFLIIVATSSLAAQSSIAIQPGNIAIASKTVLSPSSAPSISGSSMKRRNSIVPLENPHDRIATRVWVGSMLAMVAGTGMDAATSWGKFEGNSLLASSDGTFGAKGISIKASVAAGTIITEVLLHKHKHLKTKFAVGNFAETALFAAAAAHNVGISSPK